ncbi:hypothetical protein BKP45_20815 [Anaerobacillus alkalidiazotrophicus]|uniref:Endospore appendages core domain-containing protein n=1 Tax=Anaerobacillus alkalidiazotrophicus TaxID=472963 RepID=A0A1S2LWN9_9BACI|nr:S-Ena type endospore appendage [Anaerobacillus alkalidiazotrophicus]OIJ16939.1 hypothetical protein BKP45_20815 [Anaerobacillus alkalidiazotrophicus]
MNRICVKVPKVYDWVTKESEFNTCLSLIECCTITDQICCDFMLECSSDLNSLWVDNSGNIPRSGTITVSFDEGCGDTLDVFINGSLAFSVGKGQTRSQTVAFVRSLEVRCPNGIGFCKGKYSLSIHHKFEKISLPDPVDSLECYLADPCGNRISPFSPDSIDCIEIPQENGRRNKKILTPNGDMVTLQKVKLLKKGCIGVEFKRHGQLCKKLVPFEFTEDLLLCAPEGTRIECEIIAFDCTAIIQTNDSCARIEVFINVCQSIQSEADVIISLEGEFCKPRLGLNSEC